jgi:hypothetical protein
MRDGLKAGAAREIFCVALSALGISWAVYPGLRPRLVRVAPSARYGIVGLGKLKDYVRGSSGMNMFCLGACRRQAGRSRYWIFHAAEE